MNKKTKFSNFIVVFVICMIILFTSACLIIQASTGSEVSSTLITCFFTFFSAEILSLAGIKASKVIKGDNNKTEYTSSSTDEDN